MRESLIIPVAVIIPTKNRSSILKSTLESLGKQELQPEKIVIIDGSNDNYTFLLCANGYFPFKNKIVYKKAIVSGSAAQRNQGIAITESDFILFMDDDIILYPKCLQLMLEIIHKNEDIGGVSAFITNQNYNKPGHFTRSMYWFMHGKRLDSYAGLCIGPAWNILPEYKDISEEHQEVQWLNTTCTMFRRSALPTPVFSKHFHGYSLMEDLALSLEVAKTWKLFNIHSAKIFHDSQPGEDKNNFKVIEKMELINRHFVMTKVLKKNKFSDYVKLFILEIFFLVSSPKKTFSLRVWYGKILAVKAIIKGKA